MAAAAGGAGPGAARALSQREQDIQMMLAADVHLGTKNCDFQMERYVFKRRTDVAAADGWDQAGAPVAVEGSVPPVVPSAGWDPPAQPAAQGWE